MKFICIPLIFICIWIGGLSLNERYRRQLKVCEGFLHFLHYCENEIKYASSTVLDIVKRFEQLQQDVFPYFRDCTEPVAQSVIEKTQQDKLLDKKQKMYYRDFFNRLGTSDEQTSVALIEEYKNLFEHYYVGFNQECQMKMKLVSRLSLLAAATISILLI